MGQSRPRLLLVDDIDDNLFTLERRLRQFVDADIVRAVDGADALSNLEQQSADLVLLDVHMPGIDGVGVLSRMKSDMSLRDIPVIMVSAVDDFETVLRCIRLGADDYVQKPLNAELLRARVEAALDRKRLRDQQEHFIQELQREKARVDDLLHSMLPRPIVAEIKARGRPLPLRHDNVAVLFCDIVGFTEYCDQNQPENVVEELEALVGDFEILVERHGLEKIKTVGDAFMAVAGLLRYQDNPALAAATCGLDMIEAAKTRQTGWRVRVGIHLGPVVAGVIGRRGFAYDVWGDTVNTAARVADLAGPDEVVVTAALWPFLSKVCRGRSRSVACMKGKGPIELVHCTTALGEASRLA